MSRRRLAYMVKPRAVIINYILEHYQISKVKLGDFLIMIIQQSSTTGDRKLKNQVCGNL